MAQEDPPLSPIGNFLNAMKNYRSRISHDSSSRDSTTSTISETLGQVSDTLSSYLTNATERLYETLSSSSVFNTVSPERLRRYVNRRHKADVFREKYFRRSSSVRITRRELRRSSSETDLRGPRLDSTNTGNVESIDEFYDKNEREKRQAPALWTESELPKPARKTTMPCKNPNFDQKELLKQFNSDNSVPKTRSVNEKLRGCSEKSKPQFQSGRTQPDYDRSPPHQSRRRCPSFLRKSYSDVQFRLECNNPLTFSRSLAQSNDRRFHETPSHTYRGMRNNEQRFPIPTNHLVSVQDNLRRSHSVSEYTVLDEGSILTSNACNTLEKAYVKLKMISKK
ncbi:hypothetical protein DPMN_038846 [Dreissena polymorpha]|uniref:Uncharacterized protein n=1 Tax=Dreissena polymorpha TaxID=45954 RepID=A0A9D4MHT0_DREPO|nr:hypothetical protein DPMN_038846 [Dreissena polymorpha]